MAIILGLETATSVCSVALVKDNKLLAIRESEGVKEHSSTLTAYISEVFNEAGLKFTDMDAVAVSIGPGSYTGLRIGVSSAKGLCYALDKPLITIDTLKALSYQALQKCKAEKEASENILFIPMLDARRMEVYTAVYNSDLEIIAPVNALIVTHDAFSSFAEQEIIYFGEGAEKCKPLLGVNSNFSYYSNIRLTAEAICMLAIDEFNKCNFANTAYCEPFYLKDFIAGKPRVKGLYQE
jgi:tRNA threonylcarbamoyladenosine biosynthesis protein TsaB